MIIRGDIELATAVAVTAHEAGHALQRMQNPDQSEADYYSLSGAVREAEAYTFEVALARKIGEYAGVETAVFPSGYNWAAYLDAWRESLRASREDTTQIHDRGRLIMWLAVLNDPELSDLRAELEKNNHLSGDSAFRLYHKLLSLKPSEIESYMESIELSLSDNLDFIFGRVNKRVGFAPLFPGLVLNVPTLVIAP